MYVLRRLAYVQFMRLFESLEAVIESEGRKGVHHAYGYGNTSGAIDKHICTRALKNGREDQIEGAKC